MLKLHTLDLVGPGFEVVVSSDVKPFTSVISILEESEMMVGVNVHGGNGVIVTRNKTGSVANKVHFTSVVGTSVSLGTTFTPIVILDAGNNLVPFSISFPFTRLNIDEFSFQVTFFEKSHVETRRNNNGGDIVVESLGKVSRATNGSIDTSFAVFSVDVSTRSPSRVSIANRANTQEKNENSNYC